MTLNADQFHGQKDVDALFKGNPATISPLGMAGGRKDRKNYDESRVVAALRHPDGPKLTSVDPRTVTGTQSSVTRAGVQHYMTPDAPVYKDAHQAGNRNPVVYDRDDGRRLLLSGHHRAVAALLRGEQFDAVVVPGPWGKAR